MVLKDSLPNHTFQAATGLPLPQRDTVDHSESVFSVKPFALSSLAKQKLNKRNFTYNMTLCPYACNVCCDSIHRNTLMQHLNSLILAIQPAVPLEQCRSIQPIDCHLFNACSFAHMHFVFRIAIIKMQPNMTMTYRFLRTKRRQSQKRYL